MLHSRASRAFCQSIGFTLALTFAFATAAPSPPGWLPAFVDSFETGFLSKTDWQITKGDWFVEDGKLCGRGGMLFCRMQVPGSHRLEYEAVSDFPGDLSGILNSNGKGYAAGHFFGFGSDGNTCSKILSGGITSQKSRLVIEAGKTYHVICQSDSGRLSLVIDGVPVAVHSVPDTLWGPQHHYAGFYIWNSGRIDNVKLYTRPSSITLAPDSRSLPAREIIEFTARVPYSVDKPFSEAWLGMSFFSPTGAEFGVKGFFYGSECVPTVTPVPKEETRAAWKQVCYRCPPDSHGLWKARFAPDQPGTWKCRWAYWDKQGGSHCGQTLFRCTPPRPGNPGFVKQHPANPYRWAFRNGKPFHPVGLQDCTLDWSENGSILDQMHLEGPFRPEAGSLLPEGPLYRAGPSSNPQNIDVYFRRYSQCGFNLFRFSPFNCSPVMTSDQETHLLHEAKMVDQLFLSARKYGFRTWYGFVGFAPDFVFENDTTGKMERVKRFFTHAIHRWGAYTDFWEILNEQKAPDSWYGQIISHIKQEDPYRHPLTTSWERPELPGIDFNSPHRYRSEAPEKSDLWVANQSRQWKAFGKPVILGEQGNFSDKTRKPELLNKGIGGVWDSLSAQRMRVRLWTAYFNEVSFVFWNTSGARNAWHMNMWLGPREREYVRSLQDFSYAVDASARPFVPKTNARSRIRAYGLKSRKQVAVYLHHFANSRISPAKGNPAPERTGAQIQIPVPRKSKAYWYSPATARIIRSIKLRKGQQTVDVPPFRTDIALVVTRNDPLDIDKDGIPNHKDLDNDNDGVADAQDAFPLDPSEWADADRDLIGDNLDADIDGDGKGDDKNNNGIPDHEEMDYDGDGIPRANAVPWDAFPLDPSEWADSDGDGIGDNADPDDNNDGLSDTEGK